VQSSCSISNPEAEERLNIFYAPLPEVAATSDGVVVATVGTSETKGLISEQVVSAMKLDTVLVNIARPDVVDPEALRNGLRSGAIGVAFFDPIYADADLSESLFDEFDESRLATTPHIASLTVDAREAMSRRLLSRLSTCSKRVTTNTKSTGDRSVSSPKQRHRVTLQHETPSPLSPRALQALSATVVAHRFRGGQ
jgi:lactate dehydrogenase-like 2-hydroxyacid dehydrogenase